MRASVLLACLLAVAASATASEHEGDGAEANGTSFPSPEESTRTGPLDNGPISWVLSGIILVFVTLLAGVLLYMRWASRQDRRRGLG